MPGETTPPGPKGRKTALFAALLAALVLAGTADERVFGLVTDGQIMTRTAFSIAELGEIGMARGHAVNRLRPEGDAVTRYGLGPSLVQVVPAWLAGPWERAFGLGSSQTLFVAEQLLWVLLAALSAGVLAEALTGDPAAGWRAVLVAGLASPLAGYVNSDYSEPLQAALTGGAFALAVLARAPAAPPRRVRLLAVAAGACAGFALLAKSFLIVLLPLVLAVLIVGVPKGRRVAGGVAAVAGWLPFAGVWLAFELVRFGRPFASYEGEHFSHPLLDGLWRLTVGPNKGLFLYFPAALLSIFGVKKLLGTNHRVPALALLGFSAFTLLTTSVWWSWDGIGGWGPRLLMPLIPLLAALAVVGASGLPRFVFRLAFGAGAAVAALGVFHPSPLNTWYLNILPQKPLTPVEARAYPAFVMNRNPKTKGQELIPQADANNHAELSELRLAAWLLASRLEGGDVLSRLKSPPWDTTREELRVAVPPERAIPRSALVFLTSSFRWPHLGMSLTRRKDEADTVLAYVDGLYDQALRAQDLRMGGRAVEFGERLYRLVPGPQTAVALAEGLRLAGRREGFVQFVSRLPAAHKAAPEFGMVLALYARDVGDTTRAVAFLEAVLRAAPRPDFQKLAGVPPPQWPSTLRDIDRPVVAD